MALDRNEIIRLTTTLKTETVSTPAGDILLLELPAVDLMGLYSRPDLKKSDGENELLIEKFSAALVAESIVDKEGQRLFTASSDFSIFESAPSSLFNKLAKSARRLNGLEGEEEKN